MNRIARLGTGVLLCAALVTSACTSDAPRQPAEDTSPSPPPEPTHAILTVAEEWMVPPPPTPPEVVQTEPSVHGSDWRVVAVDLATGEKRTLVETETASPYPMPIAALSPDGSRLLFALQHPSDDSEMPYRRFMRFAYRAYVLDLATGRIEALPVGEVRSVGWDGDDIVFTTPFDAQTAPLDTLAPSQHSATGRVLPSGEATIVARMPDPEAPSSLDPGGGAPPQQLGYLGSDEGDLYFEALNDYTMGRWGPQTRTVMRLPSGASVPQLHAEFSDPGPMSFAGSELSTGTSLLPAEQGSYAEFLGRGLLPVYEYTWGVGLYNETRRDHLRVVVLEAEGLSELRSFETTRVEPIQGVPLGYAVFDAELERYLDQRRLDPAEAEVAEEGLWVCETDTATGETTPLALVHRAKMAGEPLGYVGPDGDVLYATGHSHFSQPAERAISIWERASGEPRELARVKPAHARGRIYLGLAGGAALP